MNASDVMSSPVIAVGPQTAVLQIAALLREQRIGGVPVLHENELVGIVTEKDLLHRRELGTEYRGDLLPWWRRVVGQRLEPEHYVRSNGRCAMHIMSSPVTVVAPETSLREIMDMFDGHGIGRVPVLAGGRMVGIVTSADLVKALASGNWVRSGPGGEETDEEIHSRLVAELNRQPWWNGACCRVSVSNGIVRFTGFYENDAQRLASRIAAENIRGVRLIEDQRASMGELPTMF